jgi:hypothetical protein
LSLPRGSTFQALYSKVSRLLAFPASDRLRCKGSTGTNALAYLSEWLLTKKDLIILGFKTTHVEEKKKREGRNLIDNL